MSERDGSVNALEVVDLRKSYGTAEALRGVSFAVRDGELFGLLGPNGAGKTTLLSILGSLLEPSSGDVRLFGRRLLPTDHDARRLLGVVPQDLALYDELTARENLEFFGAIYGLGGAELRRRAEEVLAAIGLADRADRAVHTFSGGMKRRLNLGAALLHGPRLILLDEPTTGVDPQSRAHIFDEVRRLNAAGVAVVYTSHYMEEVQALCQRVGIIDHGRLIACDTVPGLLRQLRGLIRLRLTSGGAALCERAGRLPGVRAAERTGGVVELECDEVKATLPLLLPVLGDGSAELAALETEEPNLERVFLHLTGRELRD